MYSTCLYCTASLRANEVLETLPIGRRIAFDATQGRLWVICGGCARWNLVPFDTRLETIDECERLFRDSRTRYSTDNIGMARLAAGLELVRIGAALRPEFAAWRYGRALRRRRLGIAGVHGPQDGGLAGRLQAAFGGLTRLMVLPFLDESVDIAMALAEHRVMRDPWTDRLIQVPVAAMAHAQLTFTTANEWCFEIPYRTGMDHLLGDDPLYIASIRDHPGVGLFRGDSVLPALGRTLPVLERRRPHEEHVREATRLLERTMGVPDRLFPYVTAGPMHLTTRRIFPLAELTPELRLAFEMVAHEETERRAMEGELRLLEREWREADRVARIADDLALEFGTRP